MKRVLILSFLSFCCVFLSHAQEESDFMKELKKLNLKAYGAVNYYAHDWETDPAIRNAVDLERINMYMKYAFNEKISVKAEFEFEHGGTGVTMELDKLEEFGEFETEVEAGGEVLLEQLNILFKIKPWLNVRVGRFRMYVGVASKMDLPVNYFTGHRQAMENALLPLGWYETGIELSGDLGKKKKWSYIAYLVNGLSSVGFTSANWIKRGHQKRFELANAENLAVAGRFDFNLKNSGFIGVGGYHGGANQNRPKPDLQNTKGAVSIFDFHFNVNEKNLKVRGMFLYGNLQNSDKISRANRNLSNALNVKRTPVAKNAMGYNLEVGYNVLAFAKKPTKLFFPTTDMLLHDMGEGLADGRPDFLADGNEWKTRPLWGIGLTEIVNGHTNFLHDGRARNLEEAILWHGGEAENSKQFYTKLSKKDREALLDFVNSI